MSLLGALTHTQKCNPLEIWKRYQTNFIRKPQPLQFFYYKLFNKLLVMKNIFSLIYIFCVQRSAVSNQWSAVSDDDGRIFWSWVVCVICCLFVSLNTLVFVRVRVPVVFYLNMSKKGKKQDVNDDRSKRHLKNIILLNIDLCACVCACVRACLCFNE